jgi:hypothetical protein
MPMTGVFFMTMSFIKVEFNFYQRRIQEEHLHVLKPKSFQF